MNQERGSRRINQNRWTRRQFLSAMGGMPLVPVEGVLNSTSEQRNQKPENGVGDYCKILFEFGTIMCLIAAAERLIDESGSRRKNS